MDDKIIYFELNNWSPVRDYPDVFPFDVWMEDDENLAFENEDWVTNNELCVVLSLVDMSVNFCVTATEEWVKWNCPELLTTYSSFLREPNEKGEVYGRWGNIFLPYSKNNIGVHFQDMEGRFIDT